MAQPSRPLQRRNGRGWETRRRIVAVAYRLFRTQGYSQTTVAEIAAEAGVAVPTIYLTFRSKPGLFGEVYAFAIKGEHDREPIEEPWFQELLAAPDPRRALERVIEGTTEILNRVAPLIGAMRGLSGDAELSDFERYSAGRQRDAYRGLIDILAKKRPLKSSLTPDDATSILFVMLGPEVYESFTIGQGWTADRWREWMAEVLMMALFGEGSEPTD